MNLTKIIQMEQKGSSETLRKETFSFTKFLSESKIPENGNFTNFLTWFCGFVEGDGSIIYSKNRAYLIVVQKDPKVLYWIKKTFQFGAVYKHGTAFHYVVTAKAQIYQLLLLFDGNLLLQKRNIQLQRWWQHFDPFQHQKVANQDQKIAWKEPLFPDFFQNSWLSGFTDAEGCFTVGKKKDARYKQGYRLYFRFLLDQKGEKTLLEAIARSVGGGSIYLQTPKEKEIYRYHVSGKHHLERIISYFDKFPLQTNKHLDFLRWKKLILGTGKKGKPGHLSQQSITRLLKCFGKDKIVKTKIVEAEIVQDKNQKDDSL